MNAVTTRRDNSLLVKEQHDRRDDSNKRCAANDGVIALEGVFNDRRISNPAEVNHSVSGYSSGRSSVALWEVCGTNLNSAFQSQSSWIYSLNLVQPSGSSSLSRSWTSSSPSANSLLSGVNHQCEPSFDVLDTLPTQRIGLDWINNGKTFIVKDDFRANVSSACQDSKESAPQGYINRVVSTACIPGANNDTQKEEKQKSEHQITFSSAEYCRISSIALTHHAVIVSQKAEK